MREQLRIQMLQESILIPQHTCDILVLPVLTDHKGEVVTVQGLINSGCTRSIILKNCIEKKGLNETGWLRNPIEYQTYGGVSKARKTAQVDFLFPEISTSRKVE